MFEKYKMGFDFRVLILFLIIMIPNFVWFFIPAPNDILRTDSVTPHIDMIASVCQVLMIASLCIFVICYLQKKYNCSYSHNNLYYMPFDIHNYELCELAKFQLTGLKARDASCPNSKKMELERNYKCKFSIFSVAVFNAVLGYYLFRGRFDKSV